MKTDPYSLRHLRQQAADNADQTEFDAMLLGGAIVDAGLYDDRVAAVLDDFNPQDNTVHADWHRQDLEYDTAVGGIGEELARRVDVMGDAYPFTLDDGQLKYHQSTNRVYEFCLAVCNSPNFTQNPYTELPRAFERLSAFIVQRYLGCHTECMHIGWPRDAAIGKKFRDAMLQLNKASGEWVWGPEPGLPEEPHAGDGGADFIAWKRALDGRAGQLFVLGQCACGNDWSIKLNELNLRKFKKWFHPPYLVNPVRAFVVPRHLSDANLIEASREAGLVFDRARLVLIAGAEIDTDIFSAWRPKLDELVTLVTNIL